MIGKALAASLVALCALAAGLFHGNQLSRSSTSSHAHTSTDEFIHLRGVGHTSAEGHEMTTGSALDTVMEANKCVHLSDRMSIDPQTPRLQSHDVLHCGL